MNENNAIAVILAAGAGNRMKPLTDFEHKSLIDLGGECALGHILKCLAGAGIHRATIIVGYMADRIVSRFKDNFAGVKIDYVKNDLYSHHGCEYSLALAAEAIGTANTVLITEADLLMPVENYGALLSADSDNAILIRRYGIDPKRSVVALGDNNMVSSFAYDEEHVDVFKFIPDRSMVIGESLQIWKFSGAGAKLLSKNYISFREGLGEEPDMCCGLLSINRTVASYPLLPVEAPFPEWINLNTPDDIERGRSARWLKRS